MTKQEIRAERAEAEIKQLRKALVIAEQHAIDNKAMLRDANAEIKRLRAENGNCSTVSFPSDCEHAFAMYVNMTGELREAARQRRDATPWWRFLLRRVRHREVARCEAAFETALDLYELFLIKRREETMGTENERLRAIVSKLPKTADGVPVVPGMALWAAPWGDPNDEDGNFDDACRYGGPTCVVHEYLIHMGTRSAVGVRESGHIGPVDVRKYYSSEEAAKGIDHE